MAKKGKQHKVDSISREKVDNIVHEIETAQSQKVTPEEVIKRVSSCLEQEPALTIPLIEALSRIPNPKPPNSLPG